jgi:hypothetical protein
MKKTLSICIPTRNRINTLNQNIAYLIQIIEKHKIEKQIDVIISDNSLNKNLQINTYEKRYDYIKYIYADDLGHDQNILNLLDSNSSEYIWFCQDHTKINQNSLLKILKLLNARSLDYIFASTKKNYFLLPLYRKNNNYLCFNNIYLNTNIVKADQFKKKYQELMPNYNFSHLVFHFAIIELIFFSKKNKVFYLLEQCSQYKYFDTGGEHKKMTWSNYLDNYLNILNFSSKFYNHFLSVKFENDSLIKSDFKKIITNKHNSIPTLHRIIKLSSINEVKKINQFEFIIHPTFSKLQLFILKNIFYNKKYYILFLIKFTRIFDLYFIIFLPKIFLKRFINKLKNFKSKILL